MDLLWVYYKMRGWILKKIGITMNKEVQYVESIDAFKVVFGGNNSIDVEIFNKVMSNIVELIQESTRIIEPASFLKLEIKAIQEGSFEVIIDAIVKCLPDLFNEHNLNIAHEILNDFLTFFLIKEHLKGKKPKSVSKNENNTKITNQNNDIIEVTPSSANAFFKDNKIENCVINIFDALDKSGRPNFNLEIDKKITKFNKEEYKLMAQPIIDENALNEEILENEIIAFLTPKRGSYDGDGNNWSFYITGGGRIKANIKDEKFLKKHRKGVIRLSSLDLLKVKMIQKTKIVNGIVDHKGSSYEILEIIEYTENKIPSQLDLIDET